MKRRTLSDQLISKNKNDEYARNIKKFSFLPFSSDFSSEKIPNKNNSNERCKRCEKRKEMLEQLINKLKHIHLNSQRKLNNIPPINDRQIWTTIHSGLYSMHVLKELKAKGMSVYTIIKAIKFGLISLNHCELTHFNAFKLDPDILEFNEMWPNKFSNELISNLRTLGLSESECWNIIIHGIKVQSSHILCRLMLSGIDIPGILNWECLTNFVTPKIIQFLQHIGIEEDIVQFVEQNGIDNEIEQLLVNLNLMESQEKCSNNEEIECNCNFPFLKSSISSSETALNICKMSKPENISVTTSTLNCLQQCTCQCHLKVERTIDELKAQQIDYLRQNIMVPLSWAVSRALKYKPSDSLHYISYKLLRWTHNNIIETKKNDIQECIALRTIVMDRELIEKRFSEKPENCQNCREKRITERC